MEMEGEMETNVMNMNGSNEENTGASAPAPGQDLLALDPGFTPEALSGTGNALFADRLVQQVIACQVLPSEGELLTQRVASAVTALKELKPEGAAEAMLATQMVAVHNMSLDLLARAMAVPPADKAAEIHTRQGARLLGLYLKQLEQLGRRRGRRPRAPGQETP
jgi:hypothetical protein